MLPDHPLLDRVVRGRAWIAVLGVMLAGIVAMQIEVLKLGASIGRSLQRGSSLQSRNEQLRAKVAELADGARIEQVAGTMGMVMSAPDGVAFVSVGPSLVQKAIANIHQPNPASFLALTDPNGAVTGVSAAAGGTSASGLSSAPGTSTMVPGAGTTGVTGTSAGIPTTGTTTSTGISSPTTQSAAATTSAPAATQPTAPASSVPQATSPAAAATGAAGTAALAPTQSPAPTGGTGGAAAPAAG